MDISLLLEDSESDWSIICETVNIFILMNITVIVASTTLMRDKSYVYIYTYIYIYI